MNRKMKAYIPVLALIVSLALSCAGCAGFMRYREGLFNGCQCLREGDHAAALEQFINATRADPTEAMAFALAGQVAYQMGDYERASWYLAQAEGLTKSHSYSYAFVIMKAYESLIAFRADRKEEGMAALADYVRIMGKPHRRPEKSFYEVEYMCRSRNIVLPRLEQLVNYQLSRYEGIVT